MTGIASLLGIGILATAAVLGLTHGIEPDHAAGIAALTADSDGLRSAATLGASFAVGHVVVVLAWVATLTTLGGSAGSGLIAGVGTALPGVVLCGVAALLTATGLRRLRGRRPRPRSSDATGRIETTLAAVHDRLHDHDHETTRDYLRTGVVGSLFALSPPVSMLALVSTVLPAEGVSVTIVAAGSYAVSLTLSMVLVGASTAGVFAVADGRGRIVHGLVELIAGVAVLLLAGRLLL